ncbi:MAG: hypothetical protein ABJ056_01135 [Halioglobus sp.]
MASNWVFEMRWAIRNADNISGYQRIELDRTLDAVEKALAGSSDPTLADLLRRLMDHETAPLRAPGRKERVGSDDAWVMAAECSQDWPYMTPSEVREFLHQSPEAQRILEVTGGELPLDDSQVSRQIAKWKKRLLPGSRIHFRPDR